MMTRTIEEAAKDYAYDIDGTDWERQRARDGFVDGANHVYDLPLADKLDANEKEKIRKYHKLARDGYWEYNCADKAVERVLESIFGADFFKEGE